MSEPTDLGHFALREAYTARLDGRDKGFVVRLRGISESSANRHLTILLSSHEAEELLESLKAGVAELRLS